MSEEEPITYKVYINTVIEYEDGTTTRDLKGLLLDSFQSSDDIVANELGMEYVLRIAKENGVQPQYREDGTIYLGGQFISGYWRELVERIYGE